MRENVTAKMASMASRDALILGLYHFSNELSIRRHITRDLPHFWVPRSLVQCTSALVERLVRSRATKDGTSDSLHRFQQPIAMSNHRTVETGVGHLIAVMDGKEMPIELEWPISLVGAGARMGILKSEERLA